MTYHSGQDGNTGALVGSVVLDACGRPLHEL
jgi:hypothetical protein